MRRVGVGAGALWLVLALAPLAQGGEAVAPAPDLSQPDLAPPELAPPDLAQGESLYRARCMACHGRGLEPVPGGVDIRYFAGGEADLAALFEEGRGDMPPQLGLEAADVAAILAFMRQHSAP